MRKVSVFTAVFLFLIFFVWAFSESWDRVGELLFLHLTSISVLFLFFTVFFVVSKADTALLRFLKKLEPCSFRIFPSIAFVSSLIVSHFIFHDLPHVPDEINYKFLAESILGGSISTPLHPHYEFFHILYTQQAVSGSYSIYQIGYSVFLAPFVFFKVPFLCNPLLNALSVFLIGKITCEFYGKTVAFITMALASFSLFIAIMGGTLMAHSFCAACTLASFYFAILSLKNSGQKRYVFTAVSALFISFLMFIRPQNALFILIFISGYIFVSVDKKSFFRIIPVMGSVIFIFLILFLYSNYAVSGNITELKHEKYWNVSEPVDNCMGLGLGKGCKFGTPYEMPPEGLTLPIAFKITAERLYYFVSVIAFSPLMFLFLILLFFYAKDAAPIKKDLILLSCYLIFLVVYFFYYYTDTGYGARYYFECSFFLFPLIARGIILMYEESRKFYGSAVFGRGLLVTAFISASFLFQYLFSLPYVIKCYSQGSWGTDLLLEKALEEKNIKEGVLFVSPDSLFANGISRMNLHKIDENKIIFALDLGKNSDQNLMDYYKGKKFYTLVFDPEAKKIPEITEIKRDKSINVVTAEMEHKIYPVDGTPDYCNIFPQYPFFINQYAGFILPPEIFSDRSFFFCRFTSADQFYTFGQNFEKAGNYKVRITFAATPESGKFYFETGKFSKKIDFSSQNSHLDTVEFDVFLKKGMNFIKLSPDFEGKQNYFIINKFEFFPSEQIEALK